MKLSPACPDGLSAGGITQLNPQFAGDDGMIVIVGEYLFGRQGSKCLIIGPGKGQLRRKDAPPFLFYPGFGFFFQEEFLPDSRPAYQLAEKVIGGNVLVIIPRSSVIQVLGIGGMNAIALFARKAIGEFALPFQSTIPEPIGEIAM